MAEGADDVRYDMVMTRRRMSDTVAQLEARVTNTVDGVKARLDVMQVVRDHPWPALALALAAGYALAATGADEAAVRAVADASVSAADSAKDAASNVVDRVRERFASDGEEEEPAPAPDEPSWIDRIGARVADEIAALFRGPSEELSRALARSVGSEHGESAYSGIAARPLGSAGEARL